MTEKQTFIMRRIGAVALMALGVLLLILGAGWVVSILAVIAAFWLIDRGLLMWGAPSLWVHLRRIREIIRYHLG